MGEPITEASGRFGGATCKVVVSEPCRETRRRLAHNFQVPPAMRPRTAEGPRSGGRKSRKTEGVGVT